MLKRVYLIRHGETDWNAQQRWQGMEPTPLNKAGYEQAQALADYLADRPIGSIYSSDLPRAIQTAAALGARLGVEAQVDERWREIDVGIFQGLSSAEVQQRYPAELAAWQENYYDYVIPQGESRRALQTRAYAAWQDMLGRQNGAEAVVVSHGGAIRMLLRRLFGDQHQGVEAHIANTSITTLEPGDGGWRLIAVAETPHLKR